MKERRKGRKECRERKTREQSMVDVKHRFHDELQKTSRLPPRDPIARSLLHIFVCIKN